MKEVYVYRETTDTIADIGRKIDDAAVEAGVLLSRKKKRSLISSCINTGSIIVGGQKPKEHKELDKSLVSVYSGTKILLEEVKSKKSRLTKKPFASLDEVILESLILVEQVEKSVDACSGDDGDCQRLLDSLHELLYGEKR